MLDRAWQEIEADIELYQSAGNVGAVMDLIDEQGALVDNFHQAISHGDRRLIHHYERLGVDIRHNDDYPLRLAAFHGHASLVAHFVRKGADVHAKDDEALIVAVEIGSLRVVKRLVALGANIHARHKKLLRGAAENGHLAVVAYLIEMGIDVGAHGHAAVEEAAARDRLDMVQLLVQHGADIDIAIEHGMPIVKEWATAWKNANELKSRLESMLPVSEEKIRRGKI